MKVIIPYLYDSGGLEIEFPIVRDYTKQLFSHTSDNGEVRHYDVNKLIRLVGKLKIPIHIIDVDEKGAHTLIEHNGVELEHLARITMSRVNIPGIIVDFGDKQLMVDGSHRYLKRYVLRKKFMHVYWFTEEQAKKALLDLPNI